jgi:hypothetical protein
MTPAQFWQIEMQNQQNQQQNMQQMTNQAFSAMGQFAEMYQGQKDTKNALKGMDTAVMGMSDLGVITPDFRDKYLGEDDATRPFLYQALVSPMFQSYNAGQSAAAQAQAWSKYKSQGSVGAASSGNNKYGYVYQGP